MKNFLLSLILLSTTSLSVLAQTGTGPYKKTSKASLAQKIIHIIDNSTIGAVQTVVGATHILVFGILNPINDKSFGLGVHNNKKSEVSQIIVKTDAINAVAYSLGLFQVGDKVHGHEGGHSVASAAMGPLYLPMVALSYLLEGHDNSFFETWADLESNPQDFMKTTSAQIGLGSTMYNGVKSNVVVMKFNIEQRQIQELDEVYSDKILQWVNTRIVAPLVDHTGQSEMPLFVEFDLLKKRLHIVIDNLPQFLGADLNLRNVILTEQRYVHIENNQAMKQVHIKALDWAAQYGLQYNMGKQFIIKARAGLGLSVGAMSKGNSYLDNYDVTGSFSFITGLDLKFGSYATLTGQYQKEWYINGLSKSTWSSQLHNEYRDPFKKIGFIQYIDVGAGYKVEKWETPTEKTTWSQWNATLGIRF